MKFSKICLVFEGFSVSEKCCAFSCVLKGKEEKFQNVLSFLQVKKYFAWCTSC